MSIRTQLIEIRKAQRIKQIDVANHLGISKAAMSRFEANKMGLKPENIDNYAEYLGYEIRLLKK